MVFIEFKLRFYRNTANFASGEKSISVARRKSVAAESLSGQWMDLGGGGIISEENAGESSLAEAIEASAGGATGGTATPWNP